MAKTRKQKMRPLAEPGLGPSALPHSQDRTKCPPPPLVLTVEITLVPVCVCVCAAQLTIGNSDGKDGSTKYLYLQSTTVCMSPRQNWDSPTPSLAPPPSLVPGGGAPTTGEKA